MHSKLQIPSSSIRQITVLGAVFLSFLFCAPTIHAQSIKDLFDEAAQFFYAGQYEKAIKDYERIIEADPNFAPAYNALGLALKVRGASNDDVIFYFKKAIELDPRFLPSYDNLGKVYYSAGDLDQAEENFKKGLAIDSDNESMVLSMGWIHLLGRGNPDQAIKYFKKMADKNGSAMGYFGQGICLMSQKKRMEVMEVVTKLRGINQESLAQDLEVMLRENRSLIRSAEFPTATTIKTVANEAPVNTPPAVKPSETSKTDEALSEYDEKGELRVRLFDKLPKE